MAQVEFSRSRTRLLEKDTKVHLLLDEIFLSPTGLHQAVLPPGIASDGRPTNRREELTSKMSTLKQAARNKPAEELRFEKKTSTDLTNAPLHEVSGEEPSRSDGEGKVALAGR